jgi:transcriptional regulator with XRE-family HTH domain
MAKKKPVSSDEQPQIVTAEVAFGRILKERRLKLGYTQSDLEAISQIGRSYISELESGEKQVCIRSLIRLSYALDADLGELMTQVVERMDKKALREMQPEKFH